MYNTLKYITFLNLTHCNIGDILNHITVKNNTAHIDYLWYDNVLPYGDPDAVQEMDYIIHQLTNTRYVIFTASETARFEWQDKDNMYSNMQIVKKKINK